MPPPPTLLLGQMLHVLYTVGCATLHSATPLHYCLGVCCPFLTRLAGRSSTVIPFPTLLLGQMLHDFCTVCCAILGCATPPYATVKADAVRFLRGWRRDALPCYPLLEQMLHVICTVGGTILYCATPYTTHRLNAACFGAMSVGVLGDSLLYHPLTLHVG